MSEDVVEMSGIKFSQNRYGLVDFAVGSGGGLQTIYDAEYIKQRIMLNILGNRQVQFPHIESAYRESAGIKQRSDGSFYLEGDGDNVGLPEWGSSLYQFIGQPNHPANRVLIILYLAEAIASDVAVNNILSMDLETPDPTTILISVTYTIVSTSAPQDVLLTANSLTGQFAVA
jgi:hypothetical protein